MTRLTVGLRSADRAAIWLSSVREVDEGDRGVLCTYLRGSTVGSRSPGPQRADLEAAHPPVSGTAGRAAPARRSTGLAGRVDRGLAAAEGTARTAGRVPSSGFRSV